MIVDEMDLVRQLKDAEPPRPEAYEQARAMLRDAMPQERARRRMLGVRGKAGLGAGIGAVAAAAAAIALVVTSSSPPAGPTPTATRAGSASGAPAAGSKLASLAALIKASGGSLPGNASLVIRTQTIDGKAPEVSYNLYTDSGAFYGGGDKKSLMEAVARDENDAAGIDAREVAAARYAASGDLTAARVRMVNASPNYLGLGLGPAARKKVWAQAKAKSAEIFKEKGITFPPNPPGWPGLAGRGRQLRVEQQRRRAQRGRRRPAGPSRRPAPAGHHFRGHRREVGGRRAARADPHGRRRGLRRRRQRGADDQRQHRDADQGRDARRREPAVVRADLPGLPGDAGRSRGRPVLTGSGTRPGLTVRAAPNRAARYREQASLPVAFRAELDIQCAQVLPPEVVKRRELVLATWVVQPARWPARGPSRRSAGRTARRSVPR